MAYRNLGKSGHKFGRKHLMVSDALAYGRADMDDVLHEILAVDAIYVPHARHR